MFTDTVSDFVTRIRNASMAQKEEILVRNSNVVRSIADILKQQGYLASYTEDGHNLKVTLNLETPVTHIKRLSKPGLRTYVKTTEMPRPQSGFGLIIVSTPKGVMTGNQARKQRVGGELICEVW